MEADPTRMCALLVGLPAVTVLGVGDWPHWLRIEVAAVQQRPVCSCGTAVTSARCARGHLGGFAVLRAGNPVGAPQATMAVPDVSAVVDVAGPDDRLVALRDDHAGSVLGDLAGRPARTQRVGGR